MTAQQYLFIGGSRDGQRFAVVDSCNAVEMPVAGFAREVYRRVSIAAGREVFAAGGLTPNDILARMIQSYVSRDDDYADTDARALAASYHRNKPS